MPQLKEIPTSGYWDMGPDGRTQDQLLDPAPVNNYADNAEQNEHNTLTCWE